MNWYIFINILHIIGTVLGAGAATFSFNFYLQNQKHPPRASDLKFYNTIYFTLRVGLLILVLSGFAYLVYFRFTDQIYILYQSRLWGKYTIVLALLLGSLLHQYHKLSTRLWAAVSIVSWYSALILGAWRTLDTPYPIIIICYLVAIAMVYSYLQKKT